MARAHATLLCLLAISLVAAGGGVESASDDGIIVNRNQQKGTITVIVPTEQGRLDWDDVSRGLALAGRFNEKALLSEANEHPLDLADPLSRLSLRTLSAAMPDVKLRVIENPSRGGLALKIRIERTAARRKVRHVKAMVRRPFAGRDEGFGLRVDEDWERCAAGRPLVILVHGYAGDHKSLAGLREELAGRGFPCGSFAYPNDGPLADSAELLATELTQFREEHGERPIVFVAHSMGGLVVRDVIENDDYGPFPVRRLIMICPPNHGSPWARLPGGLECFEYWRDDERESYFTAFTSSIADGLNEARHDLKPGSPFLRQINARPRNPSVHYTIMLGTAAPFTKGDVTAWREQATAALSESRAGRFVMPRVEELFDELKHVADGSGDGVVSVESGQLEGVADVVALPMSHGTVTGDEWTSPIQRRLLEEIINRLEPAAREQVSPIVGVGKFP